MCGIAGIYKKDLSADYLKEIISSMSNSLSHRGPDAKGIFYRNSIGLGHTRLKIRELSDLGSQPMLNRDKSIAITFNGEIYNFRELRNELEEQSIKFIGNSDTEVILRAYEIWGLNGLKKLEGMFSFGIWDKNLNRLILMRDRFGIKPLFYSFINNALIFGSEIKAIKASKIFKRELNNQSLAEFLWYGNSFEDRTIYSNIKSLLPGNWLVFQNNKMTIEKYWELEDWTNKEKFKGSKEECIEILNNKFQQAVERHYSADVPVSLFLSGGIDSSAIALAASNLNINKKAYTANFENKILSSDDINAKIVASSLGFEHNLIQVSEENLMNVIQTLIKIHDEPFADAANIPLYLMSKEFSKNGKVVIQGDGGDELFAGYRQYSILYYAKLFSNLPNINIGLNNLTLRNLFTRYNRILNISKEKNLGLKLAQLMTMEIPEESPFQILNKDKYEFLNKSTNPFLAFKRINKRLRDKSIFDKMLFTDLILQLPSQFLTKVDRATMAAGIEARVPFLDDKLAEFVLSIPYKWNINFFKRKLMLRRFLNAKLPNSIVNSPKAGFGVPYGTWLFSKLFKDVEESILDIEFIDFFGFNKNKLEAILKTDDKVHNRSKFLIWKIFQLSQWYFLVYN